jgi:starch phosphorylase
MTSHFNTKKIGVPPAKARKHKRTATGYLPEKDKSGKEIWPRGDEKVWKAGLADVQVKKGRHRTTLETIQDVLMHRTLDVPSITKSIVGHVQTVMSHLPITEDRVTNVVFGHFTRLSRVKPTTLTT